MTTSHPEDGTPRVNADDADPVAEAALARQAILDESQARFPVLINVLTDYFVTADKSLLFLDRYQKQGERRAEFDGLAEEIRDAIRNPRVSTPVVNAVLGSGLTPQQARSMLSELLDQMLEQGDFSPEAMDAADAEERSRRQRPDADAMFAYYAKRRYAIPIGPLRKYNLPMWLWLAGSVAVLVFGVGLSYIPWPDFLTWFPVTFIGIGVVGVAFCLVAMWGLRDEVLNPDKEERRAKEKAEFQSKRDAKRTDKGSLSDRVRRLF